MVQQKSPLTHYNHMKILNYLIEGLFEKAHARE
jgi:hypothetical protein